MNLLKMLSVIMITSCFTTCLLTEESSEKPVIITPESFDETIFNWSRTFAQAMDIAHKKHYAITDPKENMIKALM